MQRSEAAQVSLISLPSVLGLLRVQRKNWKSWLLGSGLAELRCGRGTPFPK